MGSCSWPGNHPFMQSYHDNEWGVISRDDRYLFEMLSLEGAQAGLSWYIVLSKRQGYRVAFRHFDIDYCARLTDQQLDQIKAEGDVIKHLAKLQSVRNNAKAVLKIQEEFGSLATFFWRYLDDKPIVNSWRSEKQIPAETLLSKQISRDLKKRGFKFVGPVTLYSFMQAIGMVDDHLITCPYHSINK
ncbi:DNA-3-methyladenine glycosylase I [Amphibacillus jilinensis]|uniref:DNA-3-methyladenine glycosylase I n=1 Tax=Amphibacillus jilinensis TaxID=1216008 RepID=UPI0002E94FC7|nr:DNA-3-methyladenine glycosylase I [Amphibacillus jilinensis]